MTHQARNTAKRNRQGLQKGPSDSHKLTPRVGAQRNKFRALGPLLKAGKMEEERQGPEGQSEVRAEAEASRKSRKQKTSPGAWPGGLVLDTEVSQGTSSKHLAHADTSHSVREPPHLSTHLGLSFS